MAVLRRICGITRHDRIRNMDAKKGLDIKNDITTVLQQRRLRYFGHISRMGPDRYLLLHGKVHGTRPVGRPRKNWLDNIRDDCVDMGTTITEATQWTVKNDHSGDVSSTQWAANARQYRLRWNGHKSKVKLLRIEYAEWGSSRPHATAQAGFDYTDYIVGLLIAVQQLFEFR